MNKKLRKGRRVLLTSEQKEGLLAQETFNKFGYWPEELTFGSMKKVIHKCNVCNKDREIIYRNFVRGEMLAHSTCSKVKTRRTNIKKYGVGNLFQSAQYQERFKQIRQEKYGVTNVSQCKEIQSKKDFTWLKRRGFVKFTSNLDQDILTFFKDHVEKGFNVLSFFHKEGRRWIIVQCPLGHNFEVRWSHFESLDSRCPKCSVSKYERRARERLEKIYGPRLRVQDNLDFLGRQTVDFSVRDIRLAIECDGEQHFRPVRFHGISEERAKVIHEIIKERDLKKDQLCKDNDYRMIRISHEDVENIESILIKEGIL